METRASLILLRHGEVASHRGDVPVTRDGLAYAEHVGKLLGSSVSGAVHLAFGGTRRTRETAEALAKGLDRPDHVVGPRDSTALRNPDMYLAGERVNMVSSPEALAAQVAGLSLDQAALHPWWRRFMGSPDRIGMWLEDPRPPGEDRQTVARRVLSFAQSLTDEGPTSGATFIGVTHSPIIRAVAIDQLGEDPGELEYVSGLRMTFGVDGSRRVERFRAE